MAGGAVDDPVGGGVEAPPAPAPSRRPVGKPNLSKAVLHSIGGSGVTLVINLFTGIITARLLDPDGRGELASITTWVTTASWLTSFGFHQAMVYRQARSEEEPGRILSTTLASVAVLGPLGAVALFFALPSVLAAQSDRTVELAQVFVLWLIPAMGLDAVRGLYAGHQRFVAQNVVGTAQPVLFALSLVALWSVDRFTVVSVLAVRAGSYLVVFLVAAVALVRSVGVGRPSWSFARRNVGYGLRSHTHTVLSYTNGRLDLLVMPAVLAADQIGLYSVATNGATMMIMLFGTLSRVAFPAAARAEGPRRQEIIGRMLRLTLVGAAIGALGMGLLAPWLLGFMYGSEFVPASTALRLLMPGVVLWSGAMVLGSGLKAADQPSQAGFAQLGGVVVTVPMLIVLLPMIGIEGAALTSSVAYTVVFLLSLLFLRRTRDFTVRALLAPRSFRDDVERVVVGGLKRVTGRARVARPAVEKG